MEAISENIANAEKVADRSGKVYRRKTVVESGGTTPTPPRFGDDMMLELRRTRPEHLSPVERDSGAVDYATEGEIKVVEINGERLVYSPTHPRADADGFVKMPDINVVEEMVDLITATRAYEANISVISATKLLARRAMSI